MLAVKLDDQPVLAGIGGASVGRDWCSVMMACDWVEAGLEKSLSSMKSASTLHRRLIQATAQCQTELKSLRVGVGGRRSGGKLRLMDPLMRVRR